MFNIKYKSSFEFFISRLNNIKLSDVVRQNGMYQDAFEALHLLTKYLLITQKLKVLAERMPNVFAYSLLNSVMHLSLCKELQLSEQTTEHVFLANIISDLGLLYINPDIVFKGGIHNEEERMLCRGTLSLQNTSQI
jgi:response regulator RpfG family c-di-GMP phosphodiesterase